MAYDTSKGGVKVDVEIKLEQEANVAWLTTHQGSRIA